MKRFLYPTFATLLAIVTVFSFLNCKNGEETHKTVKWTMRKADNFKIMTVNADGNWLTDIKKAMLSKHLNDGNLPISFAVSVEGDIQAMPFVGMECRLQYDDTKIEGSLRNLNTVADDSLFVCNATASFNFAKAENASVENLYKLSSLASDHLKMWVKPLYKEQKSEDWHELECRY